MLIKFSSYTGRSVNNHEILYTNVWGEARECVRISAFLRDEASPHTAHAVCSLADGTFSYWWTGKYEQTVFPARSFD